MSTDPLAFSLFEETPEQKLLRRAWLSGDGKYPLDYVKPGDVFNLDSGCDDAYPAPALLAKSWTDPDGDFIAEEYETGRVAVHHISEFLILTGNAVAEGSAGR